MSYTYSVLIIDDDVALCEVLSGILTEGGYRVLYAHNRRDAFDLFGNEPIHAVMLDLMLPGVSGLQILQELKAGDPACPVIMMSGHGNIQYAVEATQKGALDWLEKPLEKDRILVTVRNAVGQSILARERAYFHNEIKQRYKMVGSSPAMQEVFALIDKVAPMKSTVIITGETGTGKELVARAIHHHSDRSAHPFVDMNCAAVPDGLIESELFGHARGAFTGAHQDRKGKFQLADGGTLLLDEIGDLSLVAQAKVLRALETGEVTPVGSERAHTVDIRLIASTNKDLEECVRNSAFREDLFHRINVIAIHLPSLKKRVSDIPDIFQHFLAMISRENGLKPKTLTRQAEEILMTHEWPGNVRQLRNIAEKTVALIDGDIITGSQIARFLDVHHAMPDESPMQSFQDARKVFEKNFLQRALESNDWHVSETARALGMSRSILYKKIEQYGIEVLREEG